MVSDEEHAFDVLEGDLALLEDVCEDLGEVGVVVKFDIGKHGF